MKSLFAFVESFPLYVEGDLGEAFVKVQILSELQNYSLTIIGQQVHEFRSGGFRVFPFYVWENCCRPLSLICLRNPLCLSTWSRLPQPNHEHFSISNSCFCTIYCI